MKETGKQSELMAVLDYVLNRCTLREIDALEAAVERRRKDLSSSTGIISLDPGRAARQMSGAVQDSINSSMDSIRNTFREFAADMIRKEAPELSREQMEELIDAWIPQYMAMNEKGKVLTSREGTVPAPAERYSGLARKGLINGVPPDAMYGMICQFVEYSGGSMSLSDEAALREAVGDWTTVYWKKFPVEIRELVKLFLAGSLTGAEFDHQLSQLLK